MSPTPVSSSSLPGPASLSCLNRVNRTGIQNGLRGQTTKDFRNRCDANNKPRSVVSRNRIAQSCLETGSGRTPRFGDDNESSQAMTEMNGVCCSSRPMLIGGQSNGSSGQSEANSTNTNPVSSFAVRDLSYNDLSGNLPSWVNQQNLDLCIVFKGQGEDLFMASFR
ncbi:hypothetical protein RIF29_00823 [Crotalaria pallida]|uniref:Uncharacterized protein n=1 Tax=Crotalaria pallida TaxID=3830 RepID=A0AAN9IWB5_CROPI